MFKVRVQILTEPNRELENGVYLDETVTIHSIGWSETLKVVKAFISGLKVIRKISGRF